MAPTVEKVGSGAEALQWKDFVPDVDVRWCPGCGDYAILNTIQKVFPTLGIPRENFVMVSGIGCSSRFPYYMNTYGIHSIHGRAPTFAMGVKVANPELSVWVITGDGDGLSIGGNHLMHMLRRNLDINVILFNNKIYGLTKGQFSASADVGSKAKKGEVNEQPPIDSVITALSLGCAFVARSFSGDKEQLLPLIKAGLMHRGFALIDVLSPCVTFNDHEDSTKSYAHTRRFFHPAIHADFVPPATEIRAAYDQGDIMSVELHDGSRILLKKVMDDYDPLNRAAAASYIRDHQRKGASSLGEARHAAFHRHARAPGVEQAAPKATRLASLGHGIELGPPRFPVLRRHEGQNVDTEAGQEHG